MVIASGLARCSSGTSRAVRVAVGTRPGRAWRAARWCTGRRYVSTVVSSPARPLCDRRLIEQLVDLATRRLAAMLADRTAHRCEQPQFGVDRVQVAHGAERVLIARTPQVTPCLGSSVCSLGSRSPAGR
jgi:hypothetical protein